jgi:hypothetical protein
LVVTQCILVQRIQQDLEGLFLAASTSTPTAVASASSFASFERRNIAAIAAVADAKATLAAIGYPQQTGGGGSGVGGGGKGDDDDEYLLTTRVHFAACSRILRRAATTLRELKQGMRAQDLARAEKAYRRTLKSHFHIIDVAGDGNCLFAAVALGARLRKHYRRSTTTGDVESYKDALLRYEPSKIAKYARTQRAAVAAELGKERWHAAVTAEISDAITLGAVGGNATATAVTAALRAAIAKADASDGGGGDGVGGGGGGGGGIGDARLLSSASSSLAHDVYRRVIATDGVFGGHLEVAAAAACVGGALFLHFHVPHSHSGDDTTDVATTATATAASMTIECAYAAAADGVPRPQQVCGAFDVDAVGQYDVNDTSVTADVDAAPAAATPIWLLFALGGSVSCAVRVLLSAFRS